MEFEGVEKSSAEINALVNEGWKNLRLKNIQKAVSDFQQACDALSHKFGETSYECAESLFGYGSALLEQSRIENGVLGNALQGIAEKAVGEENDSLPDEDVTGEDTFVEEDCTTAEEKEKISEEVIEAMVGDDKKDVEATEDVSEPQTATEEETVTEDQDKENSEEEAVEGVDAADEAAEGVDAADEAENAEDNSEETSEENAEEGAEVGTLQLAWEVLELARTIYEKEYERLNNKVNESNELKEIQLKQADCLLKLGEVGVESETYDSAIEDYFKCKDLLKKALSADDRRFAEVSYQLGLAYGYKCLYDLSKANYEEALEVIETRIKNCQQQLEEKSASTEAEKEIEELKAEIESLSSLVPDIKNKIQDCCEEMNNIKMQDEGVVEGFASETGASAEGESSATVITHLVRKKRKSDAEEPSNNKKFKVDETSETKESAKTSISSETQA